MNVTSGLAFSPLAGVPIYCATKAALHSFTLSLRHQLKDTPIDRYVFGVKAVDNAGHESPAAAYVMPVRKWEEVGP